MSSNDKNISFYSASDIQKYLNGELSAPDMHRLEKAALEDPFLADALEGMEIHQSLPSSPSFQEDMTELRQRLNDRVAQKDRRNVLLLFRPVWKIAAAVILLLGLGLTTWVTIFNKAGRESLSLVSRKNTDRSIVPADTSIADHQPPAASSTAVPDKAQQEVVKDEEKSANKTSTPTESYSPKATVTEKSREPEERASTIAAQKSAVSKEVTVSRDTPGSRDMAAMLRPTPGLVTIPAPGSPLDNKSLQEVRLDRSFKKEAIGSGQVVFTGKVTDLNNNALSGASLYLKGNYTASTVTDQYGNFSLQLPKQDSSFNFKLTVASIGYEATSLDLSTANRTGNIIQLQPQTSSLNEVVITGFGAKRREVLKDNSEAPKESGSKKAAPIIGWPAYNSYLEAGKKAQNPDSTLKGNEIISFTVNKEGVLSSFKVEHSLSPAHDSIAIRLIQRGPQWKLLKGKKTRTSVTLSF